MRLLDWSVWIEGAAGEPEHIIETTAAKAATEYVRRLERRRCDYSVARGDAEELVLVAQLDLSFRPGPVSKFRVSGEPVPHYIAAPVLSPGGAE